MASNKKYWKSVEELNENSPIVEKLRQKEFVSDLPTDNFLEDKESLENSSTTRRDFLKYVGFSTAAASLAACEGPVINSIPYVVKPNDVIPGVADFYATSFANGSDIASVLVKVREGRPIKIEPNTMAGVKGNTNARVQASILGLYDQNRLTGPKISGNDTDWATFDSTVKGELTKLKANGEKIVLLTGTLASPSTQNLINEFKTTYGNVSHISYDAISESAALDAFEATYGQRALPSYDFSKADLIIAVGADFLGDWQGGGHEVGYAKGRVPDHGKMSRHIQIESNMTLSGANADQRHMVTPVQQKQTLAGIYNALSGNGNVDPSFGPLIKELKAAGSNAVVITGLQDKNAQAVALGINQLLKSKAVDVKNPSYAKTGSDGQVQALLAEMKSGKIGGLITYMCNPAYSLPNASEFTAALESLKLNVAFGSANDETAESATHVGATPHYLESWGDVSVDHKVFGLTQPTIKPLFNTQQFQESLLNYVGSTQSYYDYVKNYWTANILGGRSWNQTLHDGVITKRNVLPVDGSGANQEVDSLGINLAEEAAQVMNFSDASAALTASKGTNLDLVLYAKTSIGDGSMANNPWLQELPDPITRTSWDNYLLMSRIDAEAAGITNWTVSNGALNGDRVNVTANGVTLENVPVYIQPGQAPGSVGLALGYGRKSAAVQKEMQIGVNAYALYHDFNNHQPVSVEKVAGVHEFACVQLQHTLMGRHEIIRETSLNDYVNKPKEKWNPSAHVSMDHQMVDIAEADLWEKFDDSIGTKFNMGIDLAKCTGCAACVVACHAENNVPVVGKHEIRVSRDMHWLRIDRYYSSDMTVKKGKEEGIFGSGSFFKAQTHPSDAPEVSFQPVMCQHCNHAPCETVCPVAATSHGRQGQNQMAYNRCIGTRYCANNCPYRVRRFNWFKYFDNNEFDFNMNNDLGKMVLNPDVVVRSRGVMEKCSMCIQITQATILKAKKEGRPVQDGEFTTACVSACSTGAISFGDINDKESEIKKQKADERTFHLLDFVGTQPNVFYQVDVRNTGKNNEA